MEDTARVIELLRDVVGNAGVLSGHTIPEDYGHDEALTASACVPLAVVRPGSTREVSAICALADEHRIALTARGSGTGLSGAAIASRGGVIVSFERMDRVLEIDTVNHVAVVQPGVTLETLDKATSEQGLAYEVFPGEYTASLGGNVATNAGGMRAIKYGVTRHQVLGLEAVLASGEVIRTGGKFVKNSSGYDLTQLILGSEGTLALVTEATLKLHPRIANAATVLAPFDTLDSVTAAVPRIIASGAAPLILEYIDMFTMAAITANVGLDLGVPKAIQESSFAYLVVVLENAYEDRLDEDVATLGELLLELGATEVYVLPPQAASQLIEAREKAFFVAKAAGATDIVDVVVPRAAVPRYMADVGTIAQERGSLVAGCGHVGDGNVHLSVFEPDPGKRSELVRALLRAGAQLGGAISGEHGIGTEKKKYFLELEDPLKVELMRKVKAAFDPNGILGAGVLFD
jgi:glycolate dehydrogenase FAD-linked subunit